jgi:hypothetical protein
VTVKLDPGSKVTGVALVREKETEDVTTEKTEKTEKTETAETAKTAETAETAETAGTAKTTVLYLLEVEHQGDQIKKGLNQRRNYRRRKRSTNLPTVSQGF